MYVTRIFEIALLTISLNNSFKKTPPTYINVRGEEFTLFYWPSKNGFNCSSSTVV